MNELEKFASNVPVEDLSDSGISSEVFFSAIGEMSKFNRVLPSWWSRNRDRTMRAHWKDEGMMLAAFMYAAQTKIVNMPIKVVARDPNIESHVRLATELDQRFHTVSEFGQGLPASLSKFGEDLFSTDNGGFLEVVAEGNTDEPVTTIPWGVRHLDSLHVTRVNDPLRPYHYMTRTGKKLVYHQSRIISIAQMPSANRDMNGVGFCAVSRTAEIAERYADMNRYLRGKLGGVAAKKMIVGKNISSREITRAIAATAILGDAIGGMDAETMAIGGPDVDVKAIDLYNYPELNEEDAIFAIIAAMAVAWGLEFNEVYPITGTKAGDQVALQRSRGKMPAAFVNQLEKLLSARLVPPTLRVIIDYDDDALDKEREIIADIASRQLERLVTAEIVGPWNAARQLHNNNRLNDSEFLEISLQHDLMPDGTPIARAFLDKEYSGLLSAVDPSMLDGQSDEAAVRKAVNESRLAIYEAYPRTTAQLKHRQYRIALGALDWLAKKYALDVPPEFRREQEDQTNFQEGDDQQQRQPPDREDASEGIDGSETKSLYFTKESLEDFLERKEQELLALLSSAPGQDELLDRFDILLREGYLLGSGLDEIPQEDEDDIEEELVLLGLTLAAILAKAERGDDMTGTAQRMISQVRRMYTKGMLEHIIELEGLYTWNLGATEQHCSDCAENASLGPKTGSFWVSKLREGLFPQSPLLECKGFYCDCSISKVSA